MKPVDNKSSITLLQHYLHNLYNIPLEQKLYQLEYILHLFLKIIILLFWGNLPQCTAPVYRIYDVIGHGSATSQSCWQHRYHTAYCTARTLCCIAPINPPLSTLPGSPELLIFSPLEATAVAKGWQCSNLRVTHPHLPSHQQTSLL